MRIGISVMTHAGQSVWENGIGQNCLFLSRLLQQLPCVQEVILLNCGDQSTLPGEAATIMSGLRLMAPREATGLIDVAIEMAGGLDPDWLDLLRAQGKRVVFHCCGNPYGALVEPTIFNTSGFFSRAQRCDEIWILPQYRAFAPMLRGLHRCPVFEVPYLWEPLFLERRVDHLATCGLTFGYHPSGAERGQCRPLRVGVFEPNISVTKACMVPMLIADAAFRQEPDAVGELHVLNSVHMKDHPTFQHMSASLDLMRAGRMCFEQRHDFAGYASQHIDAVVSHQWHNSQNYLYMDALWGNYALIHNSPWLDGVGYSYVDFDIGAGALRLIEAAREHDANLTTYRAHALAFLDGLSPCEPANGSVYLRRLLALNAGESNRSAA